MLFRSGVASMWYDGTPGDSDGTPNGQIALAIAPASIANVVQEKEDAVQQVATDAFTSGTGPLSANWTRPTGATALQIVAGPYCEASAGGYAVCQEVYTGSAFSPDQYSEITIHHLITTSYIAAIVRGQTGSLACYGINMPLQPTLQGYLYATDGTNYATLSPNVSLVLSVGDVLRISVVGKVVSFYQNGSLVVQGLDETNLVPSTGYPGILIQSSAVADAQLSSWAGGNANVMPFGIISGNAGVAGAMVCYSGATSGCVTADGSGNYTFPSLANGVYTITPTKAGYVFSPASATETVSNGNISGANFTGTAVGVYTANGLLIANSFVQTNGLQVNNSLIPAPYTQPINPGDE